MAKRKGGKKRCCPKGAKRRKGRCVRIVVVKTRKCKRRRKKS